MLIPYVMMTCEFKVQSVMNKIRDARSKRYLWFFYESKEIKRIEIKDTHEWTFYETKKSACFDLRSTKNYILQPQQHILVSTEVYIDLIDSDLVGHIYSKSGMALKYRAVLLNSPGIIDADYKDEIKVILMTHSKEDYIIKREDAVAQMMKN
ncbi:deoxyuridine 5'-triphosphate nucleotidohydrolase-like [Hydra vulgaris]|uniref:Deoxyuridine 5'-triphosphate nucleotidohydrolase n=1 Tax=Hydra vulgaris TaxID=6087 RepID=A0ABM4DLY9_HYDVU